MATRILAVLLLLAVGIYFLVSAEDGVGLSLFDWLRDPAGTRAEHAASVSRDRERTQLAPVAEPGLLEDPDAAQPARARTAGDGPLQLRGDEAAVALGADATEDEVAALLQAGAIALRGRIVAPDGNPWPGVALIARQPGAAEQRVESGDDGAFELRLRGTGGTLQVDPSRWVRLGGELSLAPGVSVGGGERVLVLAPRTGLAGRVLDAAGAPLAGARILVEIAFTDVPQPLRALVPERFQRSARSDVQGRWTLSELPDLPELRLRIEAEGHAPHACAADELPAGGDVTLAAAGR